MDTLLRRQVRLGVPRLRGNRTLAVLALVVLVVSLGFWCWNTQTKVYHLRLGSSVELKYRKDLVQYLCEAARDRDLLIDVQPAGPATEAIAHVARGELDATVVPAGLAIQDENIRQVAAFDCEPLHLFVRPEMLDQGIAGLKGKRLNLGLQGSGVRAIADEAMQFIGMKAGVDFQDEPYAYTELKAMPAERLPDAVFSLSPLPSPLGEHLTQHFDYRLLELPFGAALALRKPAIEDVCIPAHTYGVHPAVPDKPLHTIGTRAIVVAHNDVSKIAIRRLLEVLYESDFTRRVGMPPLDESWLQRSGQYPNHAGTEAYLHRHDPWVNKDFVDNISNLRGLLVPVASAAILIWQWIRRRRVAGLNNHLRACAKLEMDALRASSQDAFDAAHFYRALAELIELKIDVLEKHQAGLLPGDQQLDIFLSRVESLQQALPRLVRAGRAADQAALPPHAAERKAA